MPLFHAWSLERGRRERRSDLPSDVCLCLTVCRLVKTGMDGWMRRLIDGRLPMPAEKSEQPEMNDLHAMMLSVLWSQQHRAMSVVMTPPPVVGTAFPDHGYERYAAQPPKKSEKQSTRMSIREIFCPPNAMLPEIPHDPLSSQHYAFALPMFPESMPRPLYGFLCQLPSPWRS